MHQEEYDIPMTEKKTVCYRTLYQEKKKKSTIQLSLDKFVKKTPGTNR